MCVNVFRRGQVNLLVYRPDRPCFKQKQKNDITKLWPTAFFLNLLLSAFCFLQKKRNKMLQAYINNQNQEVFIVIIINYKLRGFLLCLLCKILILKKSRP